VKYFLSKTKTTTHKQKNNQTREGLPSQIKLSLQYLLMLFNIFKVHNLRADEKQNER